MKMRYFDLHCDTLNACLRTGECVEINALSLDVERLSAFERAVQVFAIYINNEYSGAAALQRFEQEYEIFHNTDFGAVTPILSIENLCCINGDIDNIDRFAALGVKIASLTWNGQNELAGGIGSENGLTELGKRAVARLERCGITIDVSHLNDRSFFDLCDAASRPFIATHSNSRAVFNHPRNLTDRQAGLIFESGGLVGINLYPAFIGEYAADYSDLFEHIEHFAALGGEHSIALGSDFDGASMDSRFVGVQKMPEFYSATAAKFTKSTADKIFYENSVNFFELF